MYVTIIVKLIAGMICSLFFLCLADKFSPAFLLIGDGEIMEEYLKQYKQNENWIRKGRESYSVPKLNICSVYNELPIEFSL